MIGNYKIDKLYTIHKIDKLYKIYIIGKLYKIYNYIDKINWFLSSSLLHNIIHKEVFLS